jgi:hypothetical protein
MLLSEALFLEMRLISNKFFLLVCVCVFNKTVAVDCCIIRMFKTPAKMHTLDAGYQIAITTESISLRQ